ncbi:MAG: hypothetical protein KDA48_08305 [Amphiplicatus sp.]|nr:hypothetical protein [Amphiplicatus sp.]
MSDEENIAERFVRAPGEEPQGEPRGFFGRLRAEPLLPEAGAGGAPLTAVIAVMSFLAAIALAVFVFISDAAGEWTSELERGLTIQIKGADAETIASQTQEAMRVLQSTEGVLEARAVPKEESEKLLEPWLGKGNIGAYLNIPALIEVRVDQNLRDDLSLLRTRLSAAAPGAVLDDHGEWHELLSAAARSGQLMAFAVFTLVMGAGCAISVFAARAGLAANREIVSILHLVGATDDFVANQVQRRFLVLGLRGTFAGLALAMLALGLTSLLMRAGGAAPGFLPSIHLGPQLFITLLIVPISLCLVTAATARLTVLRTLSKEL